MHPLSCQGGLHFPVDSGDGRDIFIGVSRAITNNPSDIQEAVSSISESERRGAIEQCETLGGEGTMGLNVIDLCLLLGVLLSCVHSRTTVWEISCT
jgi:hypothetical protein